jgi:hypothetical protein
LFSKIACGAPGMEVFNGYEGENLVQYISLFKRYKTQESQNVFAAFRYEHAQGETWETPFERLVSMAKPEEWGFREPEIVHKHNTKYPILLNYLNYTFIRVQEQGKITYSSDNRRACFNTGLQTMKEEDIYITFFRNLRAEEYQAPVWTFYSFADAYSGITSCIRPLPDIPTYVSDPSELIYDTRIELDINYEHILGDNINRFPLELQNNQTMALRVLKGATESIKNMIMRNYRIAVPQWHDGKIQLLLPLSLVSSNNVADLVLVVDKDFEAGKYKARTIITLDTAYMNARLVAPTGCNWLNL